MSRKMIAFLILLFAAPIVIYFIWPSDEARIRKLLREGAAAVEARKIEDVMSKVSFTYTDEHGLTYLYLKDGVQRFFTQFGEIKVDYTIKKIDVDKDKAVADIDVRVIAGQGTERGYIAGDATNPIQMRFRLEKERTKWLVARTEGLLL